MRFFESILDLYRKGIVVEFATMNTDIFYPDRRKSIKTFGKKEDGLKYLDREGAYLLAVKDGIIALIRTPKGFFLPGGGLEKGENDEACIIRECLEETGFRVTVSEYICSAEMYSVHPTIGYFHPIQHYYSGFFEEKVGAPCETDHELVWIPLKNASEKMLVPIQRYAVERYLKVL